MEPPSNALTGHPFVMLSAALLLVAINSFFVAAEFALVRVRQTRILELAEGGNRRAKSVHSLLSRLDTYLSATQLGVTLASLALGYIGEPAMSAVLTDSLHHLGIVTTGRYIAGISVAVGFVLITSLHIIFGELLPKWWVIAHTEETALAVAAPMRLFLSLGKPLIMMLESAAKLIARRLKIEPTDEHEQAHSEDEILAIMEHSRSKGALRASEIEIADNLFEFAHTQAKEIMVPRVDMLCLNTQWSIGRNVEVAIENGFTRYPLAEGDRDHIIGMVHIKDLLAIAGSPEADLHSIKREMIAIPETKPIDDLLKELQKSHVHQAVVVDEYGGTAGMVTLEDIIEELIGEIQDEHDKPLPLEQLDESGSRYSVAGTVALDEVAETLGFVIDNPSDYDTIGGYALHGLRLPPRNGASARLEGYDVAVSNATGRRIRRLLFTKHEDTDANPNAAALS